jgi:hypothetical protein
MFFRRRIMKKKVFWGFALLMSFLMSNACKDPAASPGGWAGSTWLYEGREDDRIVLGENSLVYNSKKERRKKTLTVVVAEEVDKEIAKKTEGVVAPDERIRAWILKDNAQGPILAVIYNPLELIQTAPKPDYRDSEPEKLKILQVDLINDLQVKSSPSYIYIRYINTRK